MKITDDKLGTKLVPEWKTNTCTKKNKLKFTDYAIERFQSDFISPSTNKIRYRVYTPFDLSRNTSLKGLRLCQFEKTKRKFFCLNYWYNGKSNSLTIGEFVNKKFGTKSCQDRLSEIFKKHTNDKGIWVTNPKINEKEREKKIFDDEVVKKRQKSLREVIEYAVASNFPSNKKEGRLVATTIRELVLPAIGYNKRTLLMIFSDDQNGFGKIFYRDNKYYGMSKPSNANELFNKFPPGVGIIQTKKLSKYKNNQSEISIYDDEISKIVMENLSPQLIRNFIFIKDRSYSKKRNLRKAFKYLWNLANNKGWIYGNQTDPTNNIDIPTPNKVEFSGARFNDKRFNENQLLAIWGALVKNEHKHPFSTEAIMLMMVTGKRKQELLKIKKEYIGDKVILMPHHIMKTKKDHEISITFPVQIILDKIKTRLLEQKFQKYNFVPWLFPSTKTKSAKLYEPEYANGNGTRLKDLRDCWLDVVKETGIDGALKMLRKSYISFSMIYLKEHWKVMMISGHTRASTIDTNYNKSDKEQRKEYADEVADKLFNFMK